MCRVWPFWSALECAHPMLLWIVTDPLSFFQWWMYRPVDLAATALRTQLLKKWDGWAAQIHACLGVRLLYRLVLPLPCSRHFCLKKKKKDSSAHHASITLGWLVSMWAYFSRRRNWGPITLLIELGEKLREYKSEFSNMISANTKWNNSLKQKSVIWEENHWHWQSWESWLLSDSDQWMAGGTEVLNHITRPSMAELGGAWEPGWGLSLANFTLPHGRDKHLKVEDIICCLIIHVKTGNKTH